MLKLEVQNQGLVGSLPGLIVSKDYEGRFSPGLYFWLQMTAFSRRVFTVSSLCACLSTFPLFLRTPYHIGVCVLVTQSCPNLCNLVDRSLPDSSVHGILPAGILEWVAISFSKNLTIVSSVQFSCSVESDSLGPRGLQDARLPCPSSRFFIFTFWYLLSILYL